MEHEHEYGDNDRSNDGGSAPDQTTPTTAPRSPTAGDGNLSVSSPKSFLAVGDRLTEPLVSPTGKSAVIAHKTGSIIFGKESTKPSDGSGHDPYAGLRFSYWLLPTPLDSSGCSEPDRHCWRKCTREDLRHARAGRVLGVGFPSAADTNWTSRGRGRISGRLK